MATRNTLSVDQIVSAAIALLDRDGSTGLSMRKLGATLGVDPMAVYHHVPNRDALIVLALARVLADDMPTPDRSASWDSQIRAWARSYRALVRRHRALTYEALRHPTAVDHVAAAATRPLVDAIVASGVSKRRAVAHTDLVVDYVHGHALALSDAEEASQRRTFEAAIDTIIAGIRSQDGVSGQSTFE